MMSKKIHVFTLTRRVAAIMLPTQAAPAAKTS